MRMRVRVTFSTRLVWCCVLNVCHSLFRNHKQMNLMCSKTHSVPSHSRTTHNNIIGIEFLTIDALTKCDKDEDEEVMTFSIYFMYITRVCGQAFMHALLMRVFVKFWMPRDICMRRRHFFSLINDNLSCGDAKIPIERTHSVQYRSAPIQNWTKRISKKERNYVAHEEHMCWHRCSALVKNSSAFGRNPPTLPEFRIFWCRHHKEFTISFSFFFFLFLLAVAL